MEAVEILKQLYREGKVSGGELHCVIASVLIHAELPEATKEYGTEAYKIAQGLPEFGALSCTPDYQPRMTRED